MKSSLRSLRTAVAAVLVIAAGVLPAPDAWAQKPTGDGKLVVARELLELAGSAKVIDAIMPMMLTQMAQSLTAVAPDKRAVIVDVIDKLAARFADRKNEMIDEVAALYAETFSLEDMRAIIDFYRTPAGQRLVSPLPGITQRSMVIGQRWGLKLGREIEEEAKKELKKRGVEL